MGKALKYLDYVFVLRPTLFFAVWTGFLCGARAGLKLGRDPIAEGLQRFWTLAASTTLVMASVFIVNQLKDVATDVANNKLYLIARGEVPASHAKIEAMLLLGAGVVAAYLAGPVAALLALALFAIGGIIYSYEPFLWKNRPFLGMLVNATGALLIFSLGWLTYTNLEWQVLRYGMPYVLAVTSVYLLTTIPDEPGDRVSGKITFVVRFGFRATTRWAAVAVAGAALGGILNQDPVILIPSLASLPLFLVAAGKNDLRSVMPPIKYSILMLALTISLFYPAYLLLLAVVFFISKVYYRKRFGLNYPSLNA